MGDLLHTWGDFFTAVGLLAAILLWLEWALARRFRAHEQVEQRQYAQLAITAETAAASALEFGRQLRDVREDSNKHGVAIAEMTADVRMHDRRLGAVEERIMRAALMVPPRGRPTEGDEG